MPNTHTYKTWTLYLTILLLCKRASVLISTTAVLCMPLHSNTIHFKRDCISNILLVLVRKCVQCSHIRIPNMNYNKRNKMHDALGLKPICRTESKKKYVLPVFIRMVCAVHTNTELDFFGDCIHSSPFLWFQCSILWVCVVHSKMIYMCVRMRILYSILLFAASYKHLTQHQQQQQQQQKQQRQKQKKNETKKCYK